MRFIRARKQAAPEKGYNTKEIPCKEPWATFCLLVQQSHSHVPKSALYLQTVLQVSTAT